MAEVPVVSVEHALLHAAALRGVDNVSACLVQIRTGDAPARSTLAPLRVAAVIDRSGSMQGSKIVNARRAVRKLIKHLSPRDTLHFVTYVTSDPPLSGNIPCALRCL